MARFRSILVGLLCVAFTKVWSDNSETFELSFVTWPNETQVVVNETVKFLWKYRVKGTDVDIRWGTSKFISPKVATFKELFFTARNYEKYRKPVLSKTIPARYRDRIRIIGQASLQIVNVTLEDEGDYLCEISDSGTAWKTLSRAATLRVLVPPHIESHPLETILLSEGEQLKLGCKASGRPLPDISWYKDGVELTQDTGSSEYIKGKVSRGDDGTYMCIARNNASQDQYNVQVIVRYKPIRTKIKTDAKSDTLRKGGDLKIVCEADSKPQPTYNFYHEADNGVKKRIGGNQASTSGELYIRNVNASDRGNYSCIPQNKVGKGLEAKVRVSILFAPEIIRLFPVKVNLTKNDALKISCAAVGFPKPDIKWTKGKNSEVFLGKGDVYEKLKVDENDAGMYVCTASNTNPPDARKSVIINVFYKPIIENSPIDVPARKGDQVELKCVARGNPTPSFEWKTDYKDRLGFKSTYTIKSIKESEFGRYTCAVSNAIGTTIHTVNVFEVEKPMVTELQVTNIRARSAHVTWKQNRYKKFPIKQQVLLYGLQNSKTMKKITIPGGNKHKHTYKIKDLLPYSYYIVRVQAKNEHIASDQAEIRFQTATARPGEPGPPQMRIVSFKSVQVNWTPPKKRNGELTGYMLQYGIYNDSSTAKDFKTSAVKTSAVLKDLKNAQTYKFRVKAATASGYGNFSEYVLFTISTSEPSIPRDLKASQLSLNVYQLEWKGPLKMLGKLVKILVSLEWKMRHTGAYGSEDREIIVDNRAHSRSRRDTSFDWKVKLKQLSPVRKLQIKDLFPNTYYNISVKEGMKVKNGIYWSAKTQSVDIETPAGVPSKPTDLTVDMRSETSFSLTWKRPAYSGGKLKTYTIFYRTGTGGWKVKKLSTDLRNETVGTTVDGVIANAKYEVKVQANGHKPGLFSNTVEFRQGSKILKVSIDAHSQSSFTLTWTKPTNPTIKIIKYTVYYRQVNGKWMSKEVTSGLNNNTLSVKVNGLTAGALYEVKLQARSSHHVFLSDKLEIRPAIIQARESEENDYVPMFGGIIAGVLIFAFVIIVVAMFVRYNYRKRQRSQRRSRAQSHPTPGVLITRENGLTHMSSPSEHLSSDSPGSEKYLRPERKGNSVQVPLKLLGGARKAIPISNLFEYCKEHRREGNKGFSEEFKSIESGVDYPYEECKKAVNKSKNRYANIVTYDHTRVCLSNLGDPGLDYINANYVDGYNCPEKFIATQGPVSATFSDFWRMIWEQNCAAIVMVTNLIEKGKVKCQKYWPVTEAELFGSLTVNPVEEWELTGYTIRKFQLQQNNNSELVKDVTQFHYTAWPDHGVPTHPSRLLAFIKRVQNYIQVSTGKIVVHCSAGVGRTGTFIALETLLHQMKAESIVDVSGCVSHMRTQRNSMVQTEAQYSFIYEAILEASACEGTEIAVPDFEEKLNLLENIDSEDEECLLAKEFQNINDVSIVEKETCVNALMPENQGKNRCSSILPYDYNRVKLWPYPNERGSDYINASFVDGYRNREIFITTQAPLKESLEDFWRMTWEYECYVLIMLTNHAEDHQCPRYWPSEGEEYVVFGLLMIEVESEQELDSYIKRTLKCTNTKSGEIRKIYHVHYTAWTELNVPASASSLLNFVQDILKLEQQTGNGLTLVHCSDGSGRTGTIITIYIALERLKLESIIDVFSIVRNLRTQRVGMVESIEQYSFCYHTLLQYVKSPNNQPYQ